MMYGIIGGSGLLSIGRDASQLIRTSAGSVTVYKNPTHYFLQRHGIDTPPHRINHRANLLALKDLGITEIIAVSSVGSLKDVIKPGDLVVIDDFMQLGDIPTFYDDRMIFTAPLLSAAVRKHIIDSAKDFGIKVHQKGIYVQTRGPRYETRAEVRFYAHFADVIGMTIASEATLASELGIPYACICSVDNYANGIAEIPIDDRLVKVHQSKNLEKLLAIIARVTQ
jgi:purine nucleoside phosphorylase